MAVSHPHALRAEALGVLGLVARDQAARDRDHPVPRQAVAPRHDGPHRPRGARAPGLLGHDE